MQYEMKLQDYARIAWINIWKNRVMIFAVTLLFFFAGTLFASLNPNKNIYSARASVYTAAGSSTQETTVTSGALRGYADVLKSRKVCERAESIIGDPNLNANMIRNMISVSYNNSSTVMTIVARSADRDMAVKAANGAAQAFVIEIQSIVESDKIQILDVAGSASLSSRGIDALIKTMVVSAFAGFVLCIAAVVAGVLFSNKIKSVEQCLDGDENEVLGMIPFIE